MESRIRPRLSILPLLLALCACADPATEATTATADGDGATNAAPSPTTLTATGLGAVRLGMSVAAAEQALGAKLAPMSAGQEAACWQTRRADGASPQVFYMVENGVLTRIDIDRRTEPAVPGPEFKTAAGIGIGATEPDVIAAYGAGTEILPHKYDENGHTLMVNGPDAKSALLFETSDGKVTTFRAGLHPAVDYVEGCS